MPLTIAVRFTVVSIRHKAHGDGNVDTDITGKSTLQYLTFDSLVPVTPGNAKAPSFGRWSSSSTFIGYHTSGKYYVKNIQVSKDVEHAVPGPLAMSKLSPMTFLFDSQWGDDEPFLVLYSLSPTDLSPGKIKGGAGVTHDSYEASRKGTTVDDRVEWWHQGRG